MTTQKAVVIQGPRQAAVVTDRPLPALRDGYILVKTVAVALNPTDWKHIDNLSCPGVVVGCDYAGVVHEVGPGVQKTFQKGDRVCGFVHGSNAVQPEDGAFAESIVARGDLQIRIPDHLSFQEAATLGLGVTTAAQGLYQSLGLALPTAPISQPSKRIVLVYGGSTATGTLAIQFAKLSGYTVWTTCSPRNFGLVRSLGADAVFDYHDPQAAASVRELSNDGLTLVFDTVSSEGSARFCDQALSTDGGDYSTLLPRRIDRANLNSRATMAYTAFGEEFQFGDRVISAKLEDRAFAKEFCTIVEQLLQAGQLRVHPPELRGGGLQGVLDGLQLMREGKVSAKKLVYNVVETP
ncbi:chaperonin 10-like protein [Aspergillus floccosus]